MSLWLFVWKEPMWKQGKQLLKESGLNIISANDLTEAAKKVVKWLKQGAITIMSILVNRHTKVITQGITGKAGRFHTEQGMLYAPTYVGGVTPGKGGGEILGLPIFDTVFEAKEGNAMQCFFDFCPCPFCCRSDFRSRRSWH